ncbi:MAG: class I tRNA ligase family protein, partial [Vallitaleaceae bacterium]|nr:class I tRNA ligase family protein [Vallitaleaceae bacterium]
VDPFDALDRFGADAIRWYFYNNSAPWLPNRFSDEAVVEGQRKFMGTLWNTYAFFVLYAEIDQFDPTKHSLDTQKLGLMDKWLLSKLNSLIKTVDHQMENYKITESTRAINEFVDELSNWYVRRSRERFWQKDMNKDKVDAYMTLHTTLVTLSKLCAPFIPFMAEDIYRNLVVPFDASAPESVHFCDYPEYQDQLINHSVEKQMEILLKVVVSGRACRNGANIKNRQPLAKMFVKVEDSLDENFIEIIREELNVKEVLMVDDVSEFTSYTFKPQLRTVGPKYGKYLNPIREFLSQVDGNHAMEELKEQGHLAVDFDGFEVTLTEDDLLIDSAKKEGYASDVDGPMTVVIDTHLTEELIEEGFVREIISKIQTMRKEADFEVIDHIVFGYQNNDELHSVIQKNKEIIAEETLTDEVVFGLFEGYQKNWDINGKNIDFVIRKK